MVAYIYGIKNLKNNKIYIGSTKSLNSRKYEHFYHLKRNTHHSEHLQKSYNKYGKNIFAFFLIEECTNSNRKERELYHININKSFERDFGYNIYEPNEGNFKCSESTKLKISDKRKNVSTPINMFNLNGELINTYKSIYDCALQNNIYRTVISNIINGKRKSYKGFTFLKVNQKFDYIKSNKQRDMTKYHKNSSH